MRVLSSVPAALLVSAVLAGCDEAPPQKKAPPAIGILIPGSGSRPPLEVAMAFQPAPKREKKAVEGMSRLMSHVVSRCAQTANGRLGLKLKFVSADGKLTDVKSPENRAYVRCAQEVLTSTSVAAWTGRRDVMVQVRAK